MIKKQELNDESLEVILERLKQDEVKLLSAMRDKNCINSQLSLDESGLINLVKGLTPYKIKFIIERLKVTGLINTVKQGITKYYITIDGLRILQIFQANVMETASLAKSVPQIVESNPEPIIKTKSKKKNMKG